MSAHTGSRIRLKNSLSMWCIPDLPSIYNWQYSHVAYYILIFFNHLCVDNLTSVSLNLSLTTHVTTTELCWSHKVTLNNRDLLIPLPSLKCVAWQFLRCRLQNTYIYIHSVVLASTNCCTLTLPSCWNNHILSFMACTGHIWLSLGARSYKNVMI